MQKRPILILFLMLFAALAAPAAHAGTPLGPNDFTSVDELALAIADYFPKVKGEVTSVQNGRVTINVGRKDGILPNMVLSLWREGKELLHPATRAVIGRAEEEVGALEIASAAEAAAAGVMKRQVREPRPGDRARMSPRRVQLAVVPLRSDRPEIIEGLVERLGELGRFTVLEPAKVSAFLRERKQRDATLVREMGAAFALDAVVSVAVLPSEGRQLVTVRIFYADETQPLDTIVATLTLTAKREALGDVRPFFAPVKEAMDRTPDLPVAARFFALGDLDGDGILEHVFSSGKQLSVHRLEGGAWKTLWTETVPAGEQDVQHVYLGAADITGDGRPEIYVTRMLFDRVTSYALEFRDGAYRRIADLPGFVRVLALPGRGAVLAGQGFSAALFFTGPVRELTWTGSGFTEGPVVAVLPKGLNLYSFVLAEVGEAQPLAAALDRNDRLAVFKGDTALWRSEDEYRSSDVTVMKPLNTLEAMSRGSDLFGNPEEDKTRQVRMPGRLLTADLDGDGRDEVLAPRNSGDTFSSERSGRVHGLSWTGARLDPRWSSPELDGRVLDIQAARTEEGGMQVFALVAAPGGFFKRDVLRLERFIIKP